MFKKFLGSPKTKTRKSLASKNKKSTNLSDLLQNQSLQNLPICQKIKLQNCSSNKLLARKDTAPSIKKEKVSLLKYHSKFIKKSPRKKSPLKLKPQFQNELASLLKRYSARTHLSPERLNKMTPLMNENKPNYLKKPQKIDIKYQETRKTTQNSTQRSKKQKSNFDAVEFFTKVKNNEEEFFKNFFYIYFKMSQEERSSMKFNVMDKEGSTVAHFAVWHENIALVNFLISQKVDFEKHNKEGVTPLMIASLKSKKETLKLVLKAVNNLNATDDQKNTALHYAALNNNIQAIKILLRQKSIQNDIKNQDQKTFLDLLPKNHRQKLSQYLSQKDFQILSSPKSHKQTLPMEMTLAKTQKDNSILKKQKSGLKDFVFHSLLGKGSFGEVYLVQHKKNGHFMAMKILSKKVIQEENLEQYAIIERQILASLDNPFICKLKHSFQNDYYLFIAMEFFAGGDLGEHLEKLGIFSEKKCKLYTAEIILALEELHNRNIIFRDLKPENVLLDCTGHIKLIDFGLSKNNVKFKDKGTKSFCGSVAYVAPEMLKKAGHGKAIDYYAVGILMYEMLFGMPPFYDDCQERMFSNIQNQEIVIPNNVTQEAQDLLDGLLKKNPQERLGFKNGFSEIKKHSWFADLNWKDVQNRKINMELPLAKQLRLFELKQDFDFIGSQKVDFKYENWSFSAE